MVHWWVLGHSSCSSVFTHIQNETNKFSTEENHHKVEKLIITKLRNPRVGLTLTTVIKERKKERSIFLVVVGVPIEGCSTTTFHGKKAR